MKLRIQTVIFALLLLLVGCSVQNMERSSQVPDPQDNEYNSVTDTLAEETEVQEKVFYYDLDSRLPQSLRDLVFANREPLFTPIDMIEMAALEKFLSMELDAELDRLTASQIILSPLPYPDYLTIEQIESELNFLFAYLKYGYSGYGYFGGDAFFLPLQSRILQEIRDMERNVTVYEYNEMLTKYLLPVVLDRHFYLGSDLYGDPFAYAFYSYNEDFLFALVNDDFHITIDESDYLLFTVDGHSPTEYIKPILTASGEMAWAIGINHNAPINMTVELELFDMDTGKPIVLPIDLIEAVPTEIYSNSTRFKPYERENINDIPVIHSRRLWTDSELDEALLKKMVEEAAELRDEQAVIIDLRGNGGGNDLWAVQWVEMFTGASPVSDDIYCVLESQTVNSSYGKEDIVTSPGWKEPIIEQVSLIPNDTLTVVLADKNVGSSGELFYKYLRQMENVIIVGTNTQGCSTFGDARRIYLPESHLPLHCGYKLFIEPDFQFIECVGLMPDLWAPPDQALERALQLINNYIVG